MKKPIKKGRSLFSLFFTFLVDSLSTTIVFPIFAPLFLHTEQGILASSMPDNIRMIILGLFLGSFPFAQFLFTPLVGEYADREGRRKALIITTLLSFVGYLLTGWGISRYSLSFLFIGRFITGIGAGNLSICLASLVDLYPSKKSKVRNFSYGALIAGMTFILGPLIGGKLSDPTLSSLFNPAFPMWVGSFLSFLNMVFILIAFEETLDKKSRVPFDFMKAIHNVQFALKNKKIKGLYLIYFLYLFAWNTFFQFTPALLVERFDFSSSSIGDASAFMGVFWMIGSLLIGFIHFKFKEKTLLVLFFTLFFLVSLLIIFPISLFSFLSILGIAILFSGAIWPLFTGAISNAVDDHKMQGKTLGLSQSMQSLSMMLAPIFGGLFFQVHSSIPFLVASLSVLVSIPLLIKVEIH